MQMSQIHYLPLAPGFFPFWSGFPRRAVLLVGAVRYAYESLGISSGAAMFLLFASLIGSYFNIPVAELPARAGHVRPGRSISSACAMRCRW